MTTQAYLLSSRLEIVNNIYFILFNKKNKAVLIAKNLVKRRLENI